MSNCHETKQGWAVQRNDQIVTHSAGWSQACQNQLTKQLVTAPEDKAPSHSAMAYLPDVASAACCKMQGGTITGITLLQRQQLQAHLLHTA